MNVKLKLLSSLMEYLPPDTDGNTLELTMNNSVTSMDLIDRYKIPHDAVQVVMVNGEYVAPENRTDPLNDGDSVSVWPAIQGG